jgi:hypothetical protein
MTEISRAAVAHIANALFTEGDGEIFLDYLRSLTINQVLSPPIEASEVIYMEGRRSVYADIIQLIETSEKLKSQNGVSDGRSVTSLWDRANSRISRDDRSS